MSESTGPVGRVGRTVFAASNGYDAVDLVKFAQGHLLSARVLFRSQPICYDSAAFLGHLALEILLKAILLDRDGEFPGIHSLGDLRNAIESGGTPMGLGPKQEEALYIFDEFAASRYPRPRSPVGVGNADAAILDALWNHLIASLSPALITNGEESPGNEKGGRIFMVKKVDPATAAT